MTAKFLPWSIGQRYKKRKQKSECCLILCTDKDDTVVKYALNRNLSPALIADYQLCLPNKEALESKLCEITESANFQENEKWNSVL